MKSILKKGGGMGFSGVIDDASWQRKALSGGDNMVTAHYGVPALREQSRWRRILRVDHGSRPISGDYLVTVSTWTGPDVNGVCRGLYRPDGIYSESNVTERSTDFELKVVIKHLWRVRSRCLNRGTKLEA